MGKDPFDELDLSTQDLGPAEAIPTEFEEFETPSLEEIAEDNRQQKLAAQNMPRHLKRKSLSTEIAQWQLEILTSPYNSIAFQVHDARVGQIKRTRLYHARTKLMSQGDYNVKELGQWSLSIETTKDKWYVVCRKIQETRGEHIAEFDC